MQESARLFIEQVGPIELILVVLELKFQVIIVANQFATGLVGLYVKSKMNSLNASNH